jgi:hypothetical protein
MNQAGPPLLPIRAALRPSGLFVALREVAAAQLSDPFMQQTVARVSAPDAVIEIPNAELGHLQSQRAPAGLVFHIARCGSTLVSQLLKQHENLVVYSEPLPINDILVPPHIQERARMVAALRSLAGLFARHASAPFVIKLSSWNTLFCDIVTAAFPETPWVLCVRDLLEVAVSLRNQPPGWLRADSDPGNLFAATIDPEGESPSVDDYTARLLAALSKAASGLDPKRGRVISYERLPAPVWEVVAPHFGLHLAPRTIERMTDAARLYAKSPIGNAVDFTPDGERKRAAASLELRRAIDLIAQPELERLLRHLA